MIRDLTPTGPRSKSNLRLIDGAELVGLVLQLHENFDSKYKGLAAQTRLCAGSTGRRINNV